MPPLVHTYAYNVKNQLSAVTVGGVTTSYFYNHQGLRVRSGSGGVSTYFLTDANNPTGYGQVLEESSTAGGSPSMSYVIGDDVISQSSSLSPQSSYLLCDGHGSTRQLIQPGDSIVEQDNYDAYGQILGTQYTTSTPAATRLLYTGQQFDTAMQQYYLRARCYDPTSGRFLTMDTYDNGDNEDPPSLHLYVYCQSNPVNMTDPSGNDGIVELSLSEAIVAGLTLFSAATVYEAKTHAIGNLTKAAWNETITDTTSAIAAAESTLSIFRTSVRDLIRKAKNILTQSGQLIDTVKVVPVPRLIIPAVAAHVTAAQAVFAPFLIRVSRSAATLNRATALAAFPPAGLGQSWDEYPFASGRPLGAPSSIVSVPALQNSIQGGIIAGSYLIEKITPGTPYLVVVM